MIVALRCHHEELSRITTVMRQAERAEPVMPGSARRFRLHVSA